MPDYDQSTRVALSDMRPETGAAWRVRYGVEAGAELQIRALLERVEAEMRAAAGLAAMAMGL